MSSSLAVLGDQPRRHALERRPGGDHLDHLALGLAHDIDAAARHRAHEALALELRHRLAHRRARDAEILRQLALVEPDVGARAVDVGGNDDVAQGGVGLVLERLLAVDRSDDEARFTHGNRLSSRQFPSFPNTLFIIPEAPQAGIGSSAAAMVPPHEIRGRTQNRLPAGGWRRRPTRARPARHVQRRGHRRVGLLPGELLREERARRGHGRPAGRASGAAGCTSPICGSTRSCAARIRRPR